jgi:pimeloyl-ACP methyl ester carboxylesterase
MKSIYWAALIVVAIALVAGVTWLWTPDRPRAALEAKYLATPGDMRMVSGVRLHVRDTGPRHAPAIVMIHGLGSSLHTWQAWADALDADFRVVRFDLPGSGLSEPDPTGDYSDARSLQILAALMDQLGIARADLIGNSIGGRLAWRFAARNPDRVAKLVLVSPDGFASPGFEYGKAPHVPAILGVMRYVLPKAALRMNLAPAYGDNTRLTDDTLNRYYDLILAPGVRRAMMMRMEQTVLEDPQPLLARIKVPVLLVWGEKDAMIPASNAADYQRSLPDSTLALLPGLGHVPMEEDPQTSLVPVKEFLER